MQVEIIGSNESGMIETFLSRERMCVVCDDRRWVQVDMLVLRFAVHLQSRAVVCVHVERHIMLRVIDVVEIVASVVTVVETLVASRNCLLLVEGHCRVGNTVKEDLCGRRR